MFGDLAVRQAVEAAGDALKLTGTVELQEQLRRPAVRTQICRAQQTLPVGKFEDAGSLGERHDRSLICASLIYKSCANCQLRVDIIDRVCARPPLSAKQCCQMQHAAPRQDGCRLNAFVEWLSTRLSTRTVGKLNRPCRTLQRPFLRHQGEACRNDQAS